MKRSKLRNLSKKQLLNIVKCRSTANAGNVGPPLWIIAAELWPRVPLHYSIPHKGFDFQADNGRALNFYRPFLEPVRRIFVSGVGAIAQNSGRLRPGGHEEALVDLAVKLNVLAVCAAFTFIGAVLLGAF